MTKAEVKSIKIGLSVSYLVLSLTFTGELSLLIHNANPHYLYTVFNLSYFFALTLGFASYGLSRTALKSTEIEKSWRVDIGLGAIAVFLIALAQLIPPAILIYF